MPAFYGIKYFFVGHLATPSLPHNTRNRNREAPTTALPLRPRAYPPLAQAAYVAAQSFLSRSNLNSLNIYRGFEQSPLCALYLLDRHVVLSHLHRLLPRDPGVLVR
jgi:hypothetical protein